MKWTKRCATHKRNTKDDPHHASSFNEQRPAHAHETPSLPLASEEADDKEV